MGSSHLEIGSANTLLKATRQRRLNNDRAKEFLAQLREFAIEFDDEPVGMSDIEFFQLGLEASTEFLRRNLSGAGHTAKAAAGHPG
jgi:hypothetical protein